MVGGKQGNDALRVVGGSGALDLTTDGDTKAINFQTIDLMDSAATELRLETGVVRALLPGGSLQVVGEENDTIVFEDADEWRMGCSRQTSCLS